MADFVNWDETAVGISVGEEMNVLPLKSPPPSF